MSRSSSLASALLMMTVLAAAGVAAEHACHQRSGTAASESAHYLLSLKHYEPPDVALVDQDGRRVPLTKILEPGSPLALNFIFTTCTTVCPVMTATFSGLRRRLGSEAEELRMVSISIDPERDRPAALKAYAERFKAPAAWRFYTGSAEDVRAVARAFDAFAGDKANHRPITFFRRAFEQDWIRLDGLATAEQLASELHPPQAAR
jgi:protein SCO1/2